MSAPTLRLVQPPPDASPDTVALARVSRGDLGALGELYDRHASSLLRFASRAADRNEAEDIVQATFLKVVGIARKYDGRSGDARSWLFGIAARIIQGRHRSLARFARALARLTERSPDGASVQPGPRSDLERGLSRLAEPKRAVLVLVEIEGYGCEEVAQMLEIPVGTVWTRLHHARRELRAFYEMERR